MAARPWAASDANDAGEGVVHLYDARDNLIAELTPEEAKALGTELQDVASYVQ